MNILLAHFRVGETDGVSLEMEKWKKVFENLGHKCFFVSGTKNYGDFCIPEMSLHNHYFKREETLAYKDLSGTTCGSFRKMVIGESVVIKDSLVDIIKKNKIDLLIPNNIFSLGVGLSVAIGFHEAIKECKLKVLCHNHDFFWERPHLTSPTCDFVRELQENIFPPSGKNYYNVVINKIAQEQLKLKRNIDSYVIPNIFDFDRKTWEIDDYNSDLRSKMNINENDLIFLQATRIADRKAIELAIKVIGKLKTERDKLEGKIYNGKVFSKENRIHFLMPGLIETDSKYRNFLDSYAEKKDVEIIWCNKLMDTFRSGKKGEKIYSLWDFYAISDFITYPSIVEGWGNQFLEGIFAKKPILIFEYPVYVTDIHPYNFKTISLGKEYRRISYTNGQKYARVDSKVTEKAVEEIIEILKDGNKYRKITEENFEIGKKYFSYEALEKDLKAILNKIKMEE